VNLVSLSAWPSFTGASRPIPSATRSSGWARSHWIFSVADRDRRIPGDVLRAFRRPRPHHGLFTAQGCNSCHGENGAGTAAAPKLTAIGNKYDSAKLESLLKSPTTAMQLGGMEPVDLKQEDLDALVTYLQSLK